MKKINSAFPHSFPGSDGQHGLTKREWFAGMALQGLLANGNKEVVAAFAKHGEGIGSAMAETAFLFADDMLAESEGK